MKNSIDYCWNLMNSGKTNYSNWRNSGKMNYWNLRNLVSWTMTNLIDSTTNCSN
jgi:hypothetical protein